MFTGMQSLWLRSGSQPGQSSPPTYVRSTTTFSSNSASLWSAAFPFNFFSGLTSLICHSIIRFSRLTDRLVWLSANLRLSYTANLLVTLHNHHLNTLRCTRLSWQTVALLVESLSIIIHHPRAPCCRRRPI
jgi:membrane-associated PAP2 superfamily phosphatase